MISMPLQIVCHRAIYSTQQGQRMTITYGSKLTTLLLCASLAGACIAGTDIKSVGGWALDTTADKISGLSANKLTTTVETDQHKYAVLFQCDSRATIVRIAQKTAAIIATFALLNGQPRRKMRTSYEIERILMFKERKRVLKLENIKERWVEHPNPNAGESGKQVLLVSDYQDYRGAHMANIYRRSSLRSVDNFFNAVRRQLTIASRAAFSPTSDRKASAESSWSPNSVARAISIFKTFYNYCDADPRGFTPAMKLGLTDRVWLPEEIFEYVPKDFRKAS